MDDDVRALTELNARFLGAYVIGSLDDLDAVLDPEFIYVDGVTGEVADRATYRAGLTGPSPTLTFDQVHVHVTGDTAVVTARCAGATPRPDGLVECLGGTTARVTAGGCRVSRRCRPAGLRRFGDGADLHRVALPRVQRLKGPPATRKIRAGEGKTPSAAGATEPFMSPAADDPVIVDEIVDVASDGDGAFQAAD